MNEALGAGTVGVEHADAVATAAGRLNDQQRGALFGRDEELAELAASLSPEAFRRKLNGLVDDITHDDGLDRAEQQARAVTASIMRDDTTGMHHLFAKLTPEQGNRIRRALSAEAAVLAKQPEFRGVRSDQLMGLALDRIVSGNASTSGMGPPRSPC